MARLLDTYNKNYQKYGENVKKLFIEAMEKRTPLKFDFEFTRDKKTYKKTVDVIIPNTKYNNKVHMLCLLIPNFGRIKTALKILAS